jgi:hypothetical protein
MISVSWEPQGLVVRITGRDRFLAWPEPDELVLPTDVVSGAACHPALATLPDRSRLFWSAGHGLRTLPVVPGRWIFGRRRINTEQFYFAVRGRDIPVLVVSARNWQLDGVVVTTPEAAEIAASLSTFGDNDVDDRCRTS